MHTSSSTHDRSSAKQPLHQATGGLVLMLVFPEARGQCLMQMTGNSKQGG
jgi:hypothetical protein